MASAEAIQPEPRENEVVAGRYELLERLAMGGMGEVFKARDRATTKAVALKRLRSRMLEQRGMVGDFMREYHALSMLRHPRIIEVYDYGVDRAQPYYTMELLDGQDLSDLSPLPYREACLYLRDVASSLALLHVRRLLHRDLSPRNVRRTSDGRCKLIDFGAMIAFGVPPNVTGTAPCVAPEALQGAALDQRTDLYSFGALAYHVLTGHHGYAVSELNELPDAWKKPLVPPRRRVSEIPEPLDELVMSLLSLDPMKRPKSAAEVIDWLAAIGQLPVAADDAVPLTTTRATVQARAVTRFLRGCRSTTERSRRALQMLARCTASDEAYLFACQQGELAPIAALDDRGAPEQLTTQIRELLRNEAGRSSRPLELLATDPTKNAGEPARFRVILLTNGHTGDASLVGVAAVRDSTAPSSSEPSPAMLADLCAVLADNVRQ